MPSIPQHFDVPRFAHAKQSLEEWIDVFHKMLQRQWGSMVQAYNAILKISVTADRPSTPMLDETLWYESDTGRSFIGVNGVWVQFCGFTGNTTSTSVSYTMVTSDAIVLANSTSGNLTITVNNSSSYASRIRAVKKVDSTANTVTISPSSGNLDGAVTYVLTSTNDAVTFTSDGTDLWVIGREA